MNRLLMGSLAPAFLLLSAGSSLAAPPDRPEVERLIAEAIERSADLTAAREQADAARKLVAPASALPDPMATVSYENDGVEPSLGTESMTRVTMGSDAKPGSCS